MLRDLTRAAVLAVLALAAFSARGDQLAFVGAPATNGLGGVSPGFTVQRQLDGGALIGALSVNLSSSSPRGQFGSSSSVSASWTPGLTVNLAVGQLTSAPIYYRDGAPGTATLTASASGFASQTAAIAIGTRILLDTDESGTLYTTDLPPGAWNTNWLPETNNTLDASTAAAHQGGWGMRLNDTVGTTGSGGQNAVFFDTAPIAGDLYVRAWMRVTPSTDAGNIVVAQLTTGGAVSPSLIDVELDVPTRQIQIAGFDNVPTYLQQNADAGFVPGAWQLLEFATLGVGTADGTRRVWLDGQEIYSLSGIAWSGGTYDVGRLALGEPFSGDRRFKGALDFDDTYAGSVPFPSRFALTPPPTPSVVGACVPYSVALFSSSGAGPLPAPYPINAALTVTGGGSSYSDATCLTNAGLNFATGATQAGGFIKSTQVGTLQLQVSWVDFLPGKASVLIIGFIDGGAPDGGASDAGSSDGGKADDGGPDAGSGFDGGPPSFLTTPPSSAVCDQPFDYQPQVDEPGPVSWSLEAADGGAPSGLAFDPSSGRIHWTPARAQFGEWRLDLRAQSSRGTTTQPIPLRVICPPGDFGTGCGCGATGLASLLGAALLALARRRRGASA